jgi:hypothetical protein
VHHRSRRDPLRLLVARAIADALFFVPVLRRMSERYAALGELAADQAAVNSLEKPGLLASALLKFSSEGASPAPVVGIAPERVDHLLGDPRANRWALPGSSLTASAISLAALAATVFLLAVGAISPNLEAAVVIAVACATSMVCVPLALAAGALVVSLRVLRFSR